MIFAVYAISELTNFRNVTKCGSGSHHTIVCVSLVAWRKPRLWLTLKLYTKKALPAQNKKQLPNNDSVIRSL